MTLGYPFHYYYRYCWDDERRSATGEEKNTVSCYLFFRLIN